MERVRFKYDVTELFNKCGIKLSAEPQEILLDDERYFGIDVFVDEKDSIVFTHSGVVGLGIENGIHMGARTFLIELKRQINSFIPNRNGGQFPVSFNEELQCLFDQFKNNMIGVYEYIVGVNEMEYFSTDEYIDLCNYRMNLNHPFKEVYCIRGFEEHIQYMQELGFPTIGEAMAETSESGRYCIVGDRVVEFRKGRGVKTGQLQLTMFGNESGIINEIS